MSEQEISIVKVVMEHQIAGTTILTSLFALPPLRISYAPGVWTTGYEGTPPMVLKAGRTVDYYRQVFEMSNVQIWKGRGRNPRLVNGVLTIGHAEDSLQDLARFWAERLYEKWPDELAQLFGRSDSAPKGTLACDAVMLTQRLWPQPLGRSAETALRFLCKTCDCDHILDLRTAVSLGTWVNPDRDGSALNSKLFRTMEGRFFELDMVGTDYDPHDCPIYHLNDDNVNDFLNDGCTRLTRAGREELNHRDQAQKRTWEDARG